MKTNKFIVTRFPAGAAGRFFSCCLQMSPDISSWNVKSLNLDKNSIEYQSSMIDYFNRSFPSNRLLHLKYEPDIPYICDFYSGRYPRGENITLDEYVNYQKKNSIDYFSIETNKNKIINLILHKSRIPDFLKNSLIVNIVVDSDESHETIAKLVWLKHYNVINDSTVDYLIHNPSFGNIKRKSITKKFNNVSKIKVDSIREFYFNEIFNNEHLTKFKNKNFILEDKTNESCVHEFINFSDILDPKKCLLEINRILEKNNLQKISADSTFNLLHNNWLSKQKIILESFTLL